VFAITPNAKPPRNAARPERSRHDFYIMSELKNRAAYYEYFIEDKYDAGMVLVGTEVKSIRDGKVNFVDSFCIFFQGELWVRNMHIAEYRFGTTNNHMAVHDRKLLLNRRELRKLEGKLKDKGYTIVPLRIFFNENGYAKMEIGLGKGKKLHDKRESIKERDTQKEIKRYLNRP
jgi:SsrA-binding protein